MHQQKNGKYIYATEISLIKSVIILFGAPPITMKLKDINTYLKSYVFFSPSAI